MHLACMRRKEKERAHILIVTLPPVTCLLQVKILNYSVIQSEKESGNLYWLQNVILFKVSQLVLDEGIQYDWQLHVMIFPRTLKGKSQPVIMLPSGYGSREKWVYNLYSLCFILQSGLRDRALHVQITSTPTAKLYWTAYAPIRNRCI